MDLYAYLIVTLICLTFTFANCPDKCSCTKPRHLFRKALKVHCENIQEIRLDLITSDVSALYLKYNNITTLLNIDDQVKNMTQLKVLDLSNNQISKIEVNALRVFSSLENLNFWRNSISNIPNGLFKTLPKLSVLDLSYNPNLILSETGFGTKELWYLDISRCNLKEIPLKFFDSMPKIKYLELWGNHISHLGSHLTINFQKMRHVNLQLNNLTELQPELVSLPEEHNVTIELGGNPFLCDCQFKDGLKKVPSLKCVLPPASNTDNVNVNLTEYLNSLYCDVSTSEVRTVATNTFSLDSNSD